jgi:hypothetical protein
MNKFAVVVAILVASSLTGVAHSNVVSLEQEEVSKAQLVQQAAPEQSSRLSGMSSSAGSAICRTTCMPTMGTPAFVPCLLTCMALALKQE